MKTKLLIITLFAAMTFMLIAQPVTAQQNRQIHPINIQLAQMGLMPIPKYYPEVPRITPEKAYSLYVTGSALFALISYSDKHLIVGGIHLTENLPPRIDPNRLPFQPGQILIVY